MTQRSPRQRALSIAVVGLVSAAIVANGFAGLILRFTQPLVADEVIGGVSDVTSE